MLDGCLHVEHEGGALDVRAGQAVLVRAGEWVRYSSPEDGGASYVAVCLPAFAPGTVHRDDDDLTSPIRYHVHVLPDR